MFRYAFTFLLATVAASFFHPLQEDIAAVLARTEVLYYEAKFREAVELLSDLDDSLEADSDHPQERASLKLQLALGHLALNNFARAKANFIEMCVLDPNCALEADKYPPKILSLFEEAKADYMKGSAEQFFQLGLEAYKQDDLPEALRKFAEAIRRNPDHAMAAQYLSLARERLRLAVDQQLLEWRKHLDAGESDLAAASYRQIEALNAEGIADAGIEQIRNQPRKPAPPSPPKACVQENVQTAMLRVRTSGKPVIPPTLEESLHSVSARTVRIEARIEESGDVSVLSAKGESLPVTDAVRTAVRKWKFSPAIIDNQPRCIETIFPIVVTSSGPK